jgi:hypothetical protein
MTSRTALRLRAESWQSACTITSRARSASERWASRRAAAISGRFIPSSSGISLPSAMTSTKYWAIQALLVGRERRSVSQSPIAANEWSGDASTLRPTMHEVTNRKDSIRSQLTHLLKAKSRRLELSHDPRSRSQWSLRRSFSMNARRLAAHSPAVRLGCRSLCLFFFALGWYLLLRAGLAFRFSVPSATTAHVGAICRFQRRTGPEAPGRYRSEPQLPFGAHISHRARRRADAPDGIPRQISYRLPCFFRS